MLPGPRARVPDPEPGPEPGPEPEALNEDESEADGDELAAAAAAGWRFRCLTPFWSFLLSRGGAPALLWASTSNDSVEVNGVARAGRSIILWIDCPFPSRRRRRERERGIIQFRRLD